MGWVKRRKRNIARQESGQGAGRFANTDIEVERAKRIIVNGIKRLYIEKLIPGRPIRIILTNDLDETEEYSKGFTYSQAKELRNWLVCEGFFIEYPGLSVKILPSDKAFFIKDVGDGFIDRCVNIMDITSWLD